MPRLINRSLRNITSKSACRNYPAVAPIYADRTKGHIHINEVDCILCGICQRKCPALAIEVSKPDRTWQIDRFLCIQCITCVRECPKKCLSMHPEYPSAATSKSVETHNIPDAPVKTAQSETITPNAPIAEKAV